MFENKKLVNETEWTRVYAIGPDQLFYESKFIHDDLSVDAADIKGRWSTFSENEKLDFVRSFQSKDPMTADDEEILEFLMQVGSGSIWGTIALPLARMKSSRRECALGFLISRAAEETDVQANYYQALAELGDSRAVPVLRGRYLRLQAKVTLNRPLEVFEDIIPYVDYLSCCAALYRLDGSDEYKQAIEQMQGHADEKVRKQADVALR
jgi:hypothetical protein